MNQNLLLFFKKGMTQVYGGLLMKTLLLLSVLWNASAQAMVLTATQDSESQALTLFIAGGILTNLGAHADATQVGSFVFLGGKKMKIVGVSVDESEAEYLQVSPKNTFLSKAKSIFRSSIDVEKIEKEIQYLHSIEPFQFSIKFKKGSNRVLELQKKFKRELNIQMSHQLASVFLKI
ncbi:MAG: hypothetical protein CL678_16305 [Bdellovibrionaceae bacterium]|nr:hypothetical protein [Pseudobdellovibrionaceae bacterium]